VTAKLLPFVTKADRELREGMKRFAEWKRQARETAARPQTQDTSRDDDNPPGDAGA
jgi:hypothetical protein